MDETDWQYENATGLMESALAGFHWPCAFVRELSAVSPSEIRQDGGVVNPEAAFDVRIMMFAGCSPIQGVELHLHEAKGVYVPAQAQLSVTTEVHHDSVRLILTSGAPAMVGRALRWRVLTRAEATDRGRYGRGYPYDLEDARLWDSRIV